MTTIIEATDMMPLLTKRVPLKIRRLISYYMDQEEIPLSQEQSSIMAILWEKDGVTQQHLAKATFRGRAGVTRLIDILEKDKLVERRPDQMDRRTNLIFLTSKGRRLEKPVFEILNKTIEIISKNIELSDLLLVRSVLYQIDKNIDELDLNH